MNRIRDPVSTLLVKQVYETVTTKKGISTSLSVYHHSVALAIGVCMPQCYYVKSAIASSPTEKRDDTP